MIEFSNLIQVTPTGPGTPPLAKVYEFIADTFTYIPQFTDNEAGNYWSCDKTIVIDIPDSDARHFFSIERKAIVTVKSSNQRHYQIGTADIPARVQITSNLTSANLIIKCKMLTDPLL
uniref:Pseudouridylate synthase n=1 Tax=Prevotella sp. GTC17262 TaxID=3236797 RepID=A0AB33JIX6_9BACT